MNEQIFANKRAISFPQKYIKALNNLSIWRFLTSL